MPHIKRTTHVMDKGFVAPFWPLGLFRFRQAVSDWQGPINWFRLPQVQLLARYMAVKSQMITIEFGFCLHRPIETGESVAGGGNSQKSHRLP